MWNGGGPNPGPQKLTGLYSSPQAVFVRPSSNKCEAAHTCDKKFRKDRDQTGFVQVAHRDLVLFVGFPTGGNRPIVRSPPEAPPSGCFSSHRATTPDCTPSGSLPRPLWRSGRRRFIAWGFRSRGALPTFSRIREKCPSASRSARGGKPTFAEVIRRGCADIGLRHGSRESGQIGPSA
jgi:hypothetical protein